MITIENSVGINGPVEEVFEFSANLENLTQWAGLVSEAKQSSEGPVGMGITQIHVAKILGRQIESPREVTEYELNKMLTTKTNAGRLPMEVCYTFEPVAEGTRVKARGNPDAAGFFKFKLSMKE